MSKILIPPALLERIHAHGAAAYPEEGAGFLLGEDADPRQVLEILPVTNVREESARHNRYLISPQVYLKVELEAERAGLTVLGVFHSHPDHPNHPSEFDRDWAHSFFSYVITSVQAGKAVASRSWRLADDRSGFVEEDIVAAA